MIPSLSISLISFCTIGLRACGSLYGDELDGRALPVSICMVARSVLAAAVPLAALYVSTASLMSAFLSRLSFMSMSGWMSPVFSIFHGGNSGPVLSVIFSVSSVLNRQTADGDFHFKSMLTWKVLWFVCYLFRFFCAQHADSWRRFPL